MTSLDEVHRHLHKIQTLRDKSGHVLAKCFSWNMIERIKCSLQELLYNLPCRILHGFIFYDCTLVTQQGETCAVADDITLLDRLWTRLGLPPVPQTA